ncbi:hypothetical protein HYU15_01760 [Candidatus Woesearchaeota archaeon]|nr:hypothetical protein [Candidatus Woesearchaeota archaeon]
MEKFDKESVSSLIKERKVMILNSGWKHILSGELDEKCLWETYKFPYYFLHKLRKFFILGKPVLAGFYIDKLTIKVGHFSSCSAEVKFYEQFKKESQNSSSEN